MTNYKPKTKYPYKVFKYNNCQTLKVTSSASTARDVMVECAKDKKAAKILPPGYKLTEIQQQKLQKYRIVTNPNTLEFYRYPDIIPPTEFRTDTQDCIRIFTGGNRYSQPGKHQVYNCVTDSMKSNLSNYLINENVPSDGMVDASSICMSNFISPEYDLAGYFINHFFPLYYPDFTTKPLGEEIESFNISGKLPWN